MDIPAIARNGVDVAWLKAASVLSPVTFRDGPTTSHNPTTEAEVITWATEVSTQAGGGNLRALLYTQKTARLETGSMDATIPRLSKMALLRAKDLPANIVISPKAELVEGSVVWKVMEADSPPGQAIHILRLRQ